MEKRGTILVVDDNKAFLEIIEKSLESDYRVVKTNDATAAVNLIGHYRPDVLVLDIDMPELSGLDILRHVGQRSPGFPVIMLTAESNASVIVKAIQSGAFDYVVKDRNFEDLLRVKIAAAMKVTTVKKELSNRFSRDFKKHEIIGISPIVTKLKSEITPLKGTNITVLITGENGTGKELIAQNLHFQENDPTRKMIAVNCSGIISTLFESEVFGHVQGAFTGASQNKKGFFIEADGGDIFLDEIGELSLETQAKLLRVLQERVVTPVGSSKEIPINVRIIAATNKNLEAMVRMGTFRQDLYFRLNQMTIRAPSLRERPEDIIFLAKAFANKHIPGVKFSKEAAAALENHLWPGNIRELRNTIERACILLQNSTKERIEPEHLKLTDQGVLLGDVVLPSDIIPKNEEDVSPWSYKKATEWIEKIYFQKSIEVFRGDNRKIIDRLGVSRAFYFKKKKELGLIEGTEGVTR
ncbi:MAG: sigma-54 dependent transcriptional regulator [Bdellovibrionota bacterium]